MKKFRVRHGPQRPQNLPSQISISLVSFISGHGYFFEYKLIFPGPNLIIYNYFIAPEIQHKSLGSKSSDLYSLGMLMVALFNGGQSLIQANYSTNLYFKQAGVVSNFTILSIYISYI